MGGFFTTLFSKIAAVVQWFSDLFISIFVAFWDIFKDIFSWVLEQLLSVAVAAISSFDVSAFPANAWGSIPSELLNILSVLGVGQCVAIISAALLIRFGLQLIPLVRLGS